VPFGLQFACNRRQCPREGIGVLGDRGPQGAAIPSATALFGLPSFTPRAFAAASASFVRRKMASRSCWATSAMIPMVRSFASGMSQARNRTPLSRSVSRKAALRERRSSSAITSVAPARRTSSMARYNSGRSALRPLSTSVNRASTAAPRSAAKASIAVRCASRPSPDRPCRAVKAYS
jgi:hypothetical protein